MRPCHFCGLDLLGDVSSVEFIEDVFEGGNVHGLIAGAVHAVIDGDVLYPVLGEENLNIAACFQIVSAETGQVLGNDPFHMTGFDLCNHLLKSGTVESGAGVAVIHKEAGVAVAVIYCVFAENGFLRLDAGAVILCAVVTGEAAIQGGVFLFLLVGRVLHLYNLL